jgi:hypothetical protein
MKKLLLIGLTCLLISGCNITGSSNDYNTIISFIDENITEIVESGNFEVEPVNGQWFADGYGFTSPNHVYVDFEDGHFLFRVLLECKGAGTNLNCEALAFFETDNGWTLMQGQDSEKDNPIVHAWAKDYEWKR